MRERLLPFAVSFLCLLWAPQGAFSQSGTRDAAGGSEFAPTSLSLQASPALEIPIGASAEYLNLGPSLGFLGDIAFSDQPAYNASVLLEYAVYPLEADTSVSVISAGIGGGLTMDFASRFSLKAGVHTGVDFGFLNGTGSYTGTGDRTGVSMFIGARLGLDYLISPLLNVGLGVSYKNNLGLSQSLGITAGASLFLSGREVRQRKITGGLPQRPELFRDAKVPGPGQGVDFRDITLGQVFPVFHAYYDDHPIGTALIENREQETISDIAAYVYIRQFMDAPKQCEAPAALGGGESQEIELNALFTDKVLDVTEGTKVSAEITIEFKMQDEWYRRTEVESLRLYDRNAMTWDDDQKAAAFVTARDPMVLSFAKKVTGILRNESITVLLPTLEQAMGIHEALDLFGMEYVIDPKTPHADFSADASQVDFLQFPRQSLQYRAGDCDDLSILYCALLESVGIETAFITIPGHIYMAFSLDMSPEEARREFHQVDDLIFFDSNTWLPVETTERRDGFIEAWQTGARKWREYAAEDLAGFHPVHTAWKTYEPVGLPGGGEEIDVPPADRIVEAQQRAVAQFVSREISPLVAKLEEEIRKTGGTPRTRNKLAILYVKNGLLEKAEDEFEKIIRENDYFPALVNLGNLEYLRERWDSALEYYERALALEPSDASALLGLARTHHELENYGMVQRSYAKVKEADPELAARFAYLDLKASEDTMRAADGGMARGAVIWEEEE